MIYVSIIEDEPEIRSSLVALLKGTEELTLLREYGSAEEALQDLPVNKPTVIVVDIGLPGMSGIECAAHIQALYPDVQIMMSTIMDDDDNIMNALKAGASGYILKSSARPSKILESIHDLAGGGSAMSPEIARKLILTFKQPAATTAATPTLTPREREVLELLAKGWQYAEIADKLFINVGTVQRHAHNIYEKLHVRTRQEATMVFWGKEVERK